MTISERFEHFQYFNFEIDFLEKENFFKKLEYRFLVERTKSQKGIISIQNCQSEANVKTNRMVTTKWGYHRALFPFNNVL